MILHLDMDAFFAAVEQRDNPWLKDRCVIVGGTSNRGVVSTASYAARRFGVHSAMPIAEARRRCPQATFLRPRLGHYKTVSRRIMAILRQFSPLVQPVSIDEAFLDLSGGRRLLGPADKVAAEIKARIAAELRLTCSIGIAPLRFLAKIASGMHKPDGLTIIEAEHMQAFIDQLPIAKVPGVGPKAVEQMQTLGIQAMEDVRRLPEEVLVRRFGKFGRRLRALADGIDVPLSAGGHGVKSVSSERTLAADTRDRAVLCRILRERCDEVARQLRQKGLRGRVVTVKTKDARFKRQSRRHRLSEPTQCADTIFRCAQGLMDAALSEQPLRLVGVGISGLVSGQIPVQRSLPMKDAPKSDESWEKIEHTLDRIGSRFGNNAIGRASKMD